MRGTADEVNWFRQRGSREEAHADTGGISDVVESWSVARRILRAGSYDWLRFRQQALRIGDVDQSPAKAGDAFVRQVSDNP